VVWAGSTKLGCGSAVGSIGSLWCMFYCCRYQAKGNIDGGYNTNVKKGEFDEASTCTDIDKILHIEASESTTGSVTSSQPFPDSSSTAAAVSGAGEAGNY